MPDGHYCAWTAVEKVARDANRSIGLSVSFCASHVHQCWQGRTYGLQDVPAGTLCQDNRLVNTFEANCWGLPRPSYTPIPTRLPCYVRADDHICASSDAERSAQAAAGMMAAAAAGGCHDSFWRCVGGLAFPLQPAPPGTKCWRGEFIHDWDVRCGGALVSGGSSSGAYSQPCPCNGSICCTAQCSRRFTMCDAGRRVAEMDTAPGTVCYATGGLNNTGYLVHATDMRCRPGDAVLRACATSATGVVCYTGPAGTADFTTGAPAAADACTQRFFQCSSATTPTQLLDVAPGTLCLNGWIVHSTDARCLGFSSSSSAVLTSGAASGGVVFAVEGNITLRGLSPLLAAPSEIFATELVLRQAIAEAMDVPLDATEATLRAAFDASTAADLSADRSSSSGRKLVEQLAATAAVSESVSPSRLPLRPLEGVAVLPSLAFVLGPLGAGAGAATIALLADSEHIAAQLARNLSMALASAQTLRAGGLALTQMPLSASPIIRCVYRGVASSSPVAVASAAAEGSKLSPQLMLVLIVGASLAAVVVLTVLVASGNLLLQWLRTLGEPGLQLQALQPAVGASTNAAATQQNSEKPAERDFKLRASSNPSEITMDTALSSASHASPQPSRAGRFSPPLAPVRTAGLVAVASPRAAGVPASARAIAVWSPRTQQLMARGGAWLRTPRSAAGAASVAATAAPPAHCGRQAELPHAVTGQAENDDEDDDWLSAMGGSRRGVPGLWRPPIASGSVLTAPSVVSSTPARANQYAALHATPAPRSSNLQRGGISGAASIVASPGSVSASSAAFAGRGALVGSSIVVGDGETHSLTALPSAVAIQASPAAALRPVEPRSPASQLSLYRSTAYQLSVAVPRRAGGSAVATGAGTVAGGRRSMLFQLSPQPVASAVQRRATDLGSPPPLAMRSVLHESRPKSELASPTLSAAAAASAAMSPVSAHGGAAKPPLPVNSPSAGSGTAGSASITITEADDVMLTSMAFLSPLAAAGSTRSAAR